MTRFVLVLAAAALFAQPASATEIFEAEGAWVGEGQLATGAEAPLERGRCKVDIKPVEGNNDVSVTGTCAVAVGLSDISIRLVRSSSGRVNAGVWSAATGQTVQYSGTETDDMIDMSSTTELLIDDKPYDSQVRVTAPDADSFAIRQILRAKGADTWRLVVQMTYRKAGG